MSIVSKVETGQCIRTIYIYVSQPYSSPCQRVFSPHLNFLLMWEILMQRQMIFLYLLAMSWHYFLLLRHFVRSNSEYLNRKKIGTIYLPQLCNNNYSLHNNGQHSYHYLMFTCGDSLPNATTWLKDLTIIASNNNFFLPNFVFATLVSSSFPLLNSDYDSFTSEQEERKNFCYSCIAGGRVVPEMIDDWIVRELKWGGNSFFGNCSRYKERGIQSPSRVGEGQQTLDKTNRSVSSTLPRNVPG